MSFAGRIFGDRYHIDRLIGSGNTGEVYVAHDTLLARTVAMKVLTSSHSAIRARFIAEARAMAHLNDPHIVAIYDFGEVDGLSYIVMEYVEGRMLRDALDARALSLPRLLEVFDAVFLALEVAHAAAIIHRDLKPSNVLLGKNGEVKVADFGLARRMSDVTNTANLATGDVIGSIAYLAPESFLGKQTDTRADLYSIGVLMYEAFAGSLPFVTAPSDIVGMIYKHVNDVPVPPRALNRHLPTALERLILKLLAKEPAGRYESAHAARAALATIELTTIQTEMPTRRQTIPATDEVDPGIRALLDRMLSPQRVAKEAFGKVVSAMLAVNRGDYYSAAKQYVVAIEEFRTIKNDPEFVKVIIRLGEALLLAANDEAMPLDISFIKKARVYLAEAGTLAHAKNLRKEFERCETLANSLETAQIRRG